MWCACVRVRSLPFWFGLTLTDSLFSWEMLLHPFKNVYSILYIFLKCIINWNTRTERSSSSLTRFVLHLDHLVLKAPDSSQNSEYFLHMTVLFTWNQSPCDTFYNHLWKYSKAVRRKVPAVGLPAVLMVKYSSLHRCMSAFPDVAKSASNMLHVSAHTHKRNLKGCLVFKYSIKVFP